MKLALWHVPCDADHHQFRCKRGSFLNRSICLTTLSSLMKLLSRSTTHVATAIFIATDMMAALTMKVLTHQQHAVALLLWIAVVGASVRLLLSLSLHKCPSETSGSTSWRCFRL